MARLGKGASPAGAVEKWSKKPPTQDSSDRADCSGLELPPACNNFLQATLKVLSLKGVHKVLNEKNQDSAVRCWR